MNDTTTKIAQETLPPSQQIFHTLQENDWDLKATWAALDDESRKAYKQIVAKQKLTLVTAKGNQPISVTRIGHPVCFQGKFIGEIFELVATIDHSPTRLEPFKGILKNLPQHNVHGRDSARNLFTGCPISGDEKPLIIDSGYQVEGTRATMHIIPVIPAEKTPAQPTPAQGL